MAEPRIFISSTYSDLKDVREELSRFIREFGYIPVTFERDGVPFQPDKLIEESCYDEIRTCTMMLLVLRWKTGSISHIMKHNDSFKGKISVTRGEYLTAKEIGIPILIFIDKSSYDEYHTWVKSGRNKSFQFNYLENISLAYFIDEIYHDKSFRYLHSYQDIREIEEKLKRQWAGLFHKYLTNAQKYILRKGEPVYINSFKLYYFRRNQNISLVNLSNCSGIKTSRIQKIEDAGKRKSHIEVEDFEQVTYDEAQRIANCLKCSIGNIKAGLPDDFLSQYLLYYFKNKGTQQRKRKKTKDISLFPAKVVVFDFDGTLTISHNNYTTWEKIWLYLGYEVNECAELHRQYSIAEITHKQWCTITEKKFQSNKLNSSDVDKIADEIKLIDGASEVISELYNLGIRLYICSGSIKPIIKRILGDLYYKFIDVKANDFIFDSQGYLKAIIGTKYDFEGKSDFLSQIMKDNRVSAIETLFIGNSLNDEWAHQSGAMTLCVNPSMTNPDHPFQWTYCIRNMINLNEILKFVGSNTLPIPQDG